MLFRNAAAVAAAGFIAFSFGAPANALTAKMCSEKYKAAQEAKTLVARAGTTSSVLSAVPMKPRPGATPAAAPATTAPAAKWRRRPPQRLRPQPLQLLPPRPPRA